MATLFHVTDKDNCIVKCHYCEKEQKREEITILIHFFHFSNKEVKQDWKPGTMIYPLPAVLVSCGKEESEYNIITVAWTGYDLHKPAHVLYIRTPERHSYEIIKVEYGVWY